jgi:hypothetical protein
VSVAGDQQEHRAAPILKKKIRWTTRSILIAGHAVRQVIWMADQRCTKCHDYIMIGLALKRDESNIPSEDRCNRKSGGQGTPMEA